MLGYEHATTMKDAAQLRGLNLFLRGIEVKSQEGDVILSFVAADSVGPA